MRTKFAIRQKYNSISHSSHPRFLICDIYRHAGEVRGRVAYADNADKIMLFGSREEAERVAEKMAALFEDSTLEAVEVELRTVITSVNGDDCITMSSLNPPGDDNGWR